MDVDVLACAHSFVMHIYVERAAESRTTKSIRTKVQRAMLYADVRRRYVRCCSSLLEQVRLKKQPVLAARVLKTSLRFIG